MPSPTPALSRARSGSSLSTLTADYLSADMSLHDMSEDEQVATTDRRVRSLEEELAGLRSEHKATHALLQCFIQKFD